MVIFVFVKKNHIGENRIPFRMQVGIVQAVNTDLRSLWPIS